MKNTVGVYKITCLANNKIYIGSSKNIDKRFKNHIQKLENNKHTNSYLQSAWNLHSKENFKFEIIETCDEKELITKEQMWMDKTNCYNREIGFNACVKADRPLGYKHDDIAKQKMSKAKLGIKPPKDRIEKTRQKNIGKKRSEEFKINLSHQRTGHQNPMFGKKLSEEERKQKGINLNSVKRWNHGLTKETDARVAKLSPWKDRTTPNAIKCKLINIKTNETWEAESMIKLAEASPISLPTLHRLKNNTIGNKYKNTYRLEVI